MKTDSRDNLLRSYHEILKSIIVQLPGTWVLNDGPCVYSWDVMIHGKLSNSATPYYYTYKKDYIFNGNLYSQFSDDHLMIAYYKHTKHSVYIGMVYRRLIEVPIFNPDLISTLSSVINNYIKQCDSKFKTALEYGFP